MKEIAPQTSRAPASNIPVLTPVYALTALRRRPLWKAQTVQDYLDLPNDDCFQSQIECGKLAWAWDIGAARDRQRKEVRVLAHCVVEQAYGTIKSVGPTAKLTLDRVVELVLPHHLPSIKGTELQRVFSCSPQHVMDLGRQGELRRVPEKLPKSGPNSSPHFTRESFFRFLEKRRLL